MRTTWSDLDRVQRIESRARDTQPIRGVRSSLTIWLARGCKRWHPLALVRRYGTGRSSLSEYVSPSISQIYNKLGGPFENKMSDTFFYKEVCFVHPLNFVNHVWLSMQHEYFSRSQQCSSLDGLYSSSYFQALHPFTNSLVTVPSSRIIIDYTVIFMFHSFFNSLARSTYLYLFSLSFNFTLWSAGTTKSTIR